MSHQPVIALLTDFGLEDTFVGQMKGVILSICREATIIDLTHAVSPQNVRLAAFLLDRSIRYLPEGAIVCCVVDPGVGTSRHALAVAAGGRVFIAPDNGLLTPVFDTFPDARAYSITDPRFMLPDGSATLHGRDIFSPAAAHLAAGVAVESLGEPLETVTCARIEPFRNSTEDGGLSRTGEVIAIDHFGNLVTSIEGALIGEPSAWRVTAGTACNIPILKTYAEAPEFEPLAYIGSSGMLEIAIRNGNACKELHLKESDPVYLVGSDPEQ